VTARDTVEWFALVALGVQLPIPFFWLMVHPLVRHWRRNPRGVFQVAAPLAWIPVSLLLLAFRERLVDATHAPVWAMALGVALVLADVWLIFRIHAEFSGEKLFGHAELKDARQLHTSGLFAQVRHPRYAGMLASVAGACLAAGTLLLWLVAALWSIFAMLAVLAEERELRARFGSAYDDYARRVPRFLPFRFFPREER